MSGIAEQKLSMPSLQKYTHVKKDFYELKLRIDNIYNSSLFLPRVTVCLLHRLPLSLLCYINVVYQSLLML